MIVACRPQVPTETAAHATAQQALTKISIGGQSADSTAAYWRCAELVHVCRKCPPHFLRADLMGPWGQIQESQHFLHSHPACHMEAGVRTACACEISKAMELKAFCGSPSATRLKKVAFSRQSCLFLPNEIDSKNFCFKHPAALLAHQPWLTTEFPSLLKSHEIHSLAHAS